MVLETPKLVRSLFMTIPKSVPNFIIFPCSLHRAAIDSHGTRRRIIINIAASSNAGAEPGNSGKSKTADAERT